jgi:hypothetical protein
MTHRIRCTTKFDITATGVRSQFKLSHVPFVDNNGNKIVDVSTWNKARNQQRNWETIIQVISLRTLPDNIVSPVQVIKNNEKHWQSEFEINDIATLTTNDITFNELLADCQDVPMLINLDEDPGVETSLKGFGNRINIWFELVDTK